MRSIVDRPFLHTTKYQEQQWRAVRDEAHPDILEFERLFVRKMAKVHGVPMFASEVWRDAARQTELFVKGHSNAKAGASPHQHGMAVDIIHSVKAWDMDRKSWDLIGHIGKELATQNGFALKWGGDFKSLWDPAHWEIYNWKELI